VAGSSNGRTWKLIGLIMKFCQLNYIYMEFEAYLKIGSGPIELTEDRKSK